MSKVESQTIEDLITQLGGRQNIVTLTHCITRLRLVLQHPEQANIDSIKALSVVKGCFTHGGQCQIVIGTDVEAYYQALQAAIGKAPENQDAARHAMRHKMSLWERAISHFAEIFYPLLPALISGGLILGVRNVIGDIPLVEGLSLIERSPVCRTIYDFLWLLGEAIFYYLPVAICWSAVKKMGGTPVLGIILGITLVSPQLMNAYSIGQQIPAVWDFGGFTVQRIGYQAQVIPSLLAGIMLAMIERRLKKWIPSSLHLVSVPVLSLLLAVFLAHTVIGPIGRSIGDGIAWAITNVMTGSFAPIGAALFGFLYALLVITGVHQTTLAIDLQMIQSMGHTPVWPLIALSNIAQGSAVIGIMLISRKVNERETSMPAAISAMLGVAEPAMYGINLKYGFPMLCAMIGSALAALLCGMSGVMANGIGVGGLPGILSIKPSFWSVYLVAMAIAVVIPVILTTTVYRRKQRLGALPNG